MQDLSASVFAVLLAWLVDIALVLLQVALNYLMCNGAVVIPGAKNTVQVCPVYLLLVALNCLMCTAMSYCYYHFVNPLTLAGHSSCWALQRAQSRRLLIRDQSASVSGRLGQFSCTNIHAWL